jgi:hypothetical protein
MLSGTFLNIFVAFRDVVGSLDRAKSLLVKGLYAHLSEANQADTVTNAREVTAVNTVVIVVVI